jgi:hypothetical protein
MRLKSACYLLPLLLSLSHTAHASSQCAATLSELKAMMGGQAFPLKWEETSMDDGKPLLVNITENQGVLNMAFTKAGEGLWAEGDGVICKTATGLETRFSGDQIHVGPAANWMLRYALKKGGKFTLTQLGADQLRIATSGWSGTFCPRIK